MYIPRANAIDDPDEVRAMVRAQGSGHVITGGESGPHATLLPLLWEGDVVEAHFALANDHWRLIEPESPCLIVVAGPEAYISPSWYATKAEHGRVVPTWNYSEVQLRGRATTYDDPERLRDLVERLTDAHEAHRPERWRIDDAPDGFVAGQLRAIVGLRVEIESVEAKAKLSQNRSPADREGVVAGLAGEPGWSARAVAAQMETQARADAPPGIGSGLAGQRHGAAGAS